MKRFDEARGLIRDEALEGGGADEAARSRVESLGATQTEADNPTPRSFETLIYEPARKRIDLGIDLLADQAGRVLADQRRVLFPTARRVFMSRLTPSPATHCIKEFKRRASD